MADEFLTSDALPFCGGCGHSLITKNTARALTRLGLEPLDVILVTDIGCHGIIDRCFLTHTVHGLHGRAAALGAGIAMATSGGGHNRIEPSAVSRQPLVVVYVGDGGACIGLQHLIDAACRNVNMTVVVHNNMLYGMTGGQPSGLTPCGFRTPTCPEGKPGPGYDLCRLVHSAGAPYARRLVAAGDFSEQLAEAFGVPGFALVEVIELCPSYGTKLNPNRKLAEIVAEAGWELDCYTNPARPACALELHPDRPSLLAADPIAVSFSSGLKEPVTIMLAGSAGEGVQQAAEIFCRAAIASGLHAAKKSTYPVTVGTGFSAAELIISPDPILYTGITRPDFCIVVSADGLRYCQGTIAAMVRDATADGRSQKSEVLHSATCNLQPAMGSCPKSRTILIDDSLELPARGVPSSGNRMEPTADSRQPSAIIVRRPFRANAGPKNAALYALFCLLRLRPVFPIEALAAAVSQSKLTASVNLDRLLQEPIGPATKTEVTND